MRSPVAAKARPKNSLLPSRTARLLKRDKNWYIKTLPKPLVEAKGKHHSLVWNLSRSLSEIELSHVRPVCSPGYAGQNPLRFSNPLLLGLLNKMFNKKMSRRLHLSTSLLWRQCALQARQQHRTRSQLWKKLRAALSWALKISDLQQTKRRL